MQELLKKIDDYRAGGHCTPVMHDIFKNMLHEFVHARQRKSA